MVIDTTKQKIVILEQARMELDPIDGVVYVTGVDSFLTKHDFIHLKKIKNASTDNKNFVIVETFTAVYIIKDYTSPHSKNNIVNFLNHYTSSCT